MKKIATILCPLLLTGCYSESDYFEVSLDYYRCAAFQQIETHEDYRTIENNAEIEQQKYKEANDLSLAEVRKTEYKARQKMIAEHKSMVKTNSAREWIRLAKESCEKLYTL